MNNETEDTTIYKVVLNHEEQYSIWPADPENALGWRDAARPEQKKSASLTSKRSGLICVRLVCAADGRSCETRMRPASCLRCNVLAARFFRIEAEFFWLTHSNRVSIMARVIPPTHNKNLSDTLVNFR